MVIVMSINFNSMGDASGSQDYHYMEAQFSWSETMHIKHHS